MWNNCKSMHQPEIFLLYYLLTMHLCPLMIYGGAVIDNVRLGSTWKYLKSTHPIDERVYYIIIYNSICNHQTTWSDEAFWLVCYIIIQNTQHSSIRHYNLISNYLIKLIINSKFNNWNNNKSTKIIKIWNIIYI